MIITGGFMTTYGVLNITMGWVTMILGLGTGSIIGMWAFSGPFKPPKTHSNYTDLPRRMVRLGHIALVALPIISILYGQYIDVVPLTDTLKMWGSYTWLVCMWGVPLFLFLGSVWLPFKYAEVVPVTCGIISLCIMAYGHLLKAGF